MKVFAPNLSLRNFPYDYLAHIGPTRRKHASSQLHLFRSLSNKLGPMFKSQSIGQIAVLRCDQHSSIVQTNVAAAARKGLSSQNSSAMRPTCSHLWASSGIGSSKGDASSFTVSASRLYITFTMMANASVDHFPNIVAVFVIEGASIWALGDPCCIVLDKRLVLRIDARRLPMDLGEECPSTCELRRKTHNPVQRSLLDQYE